MNYWLRGISKWLPMVITLLALFWIVSYLIDRKKFESPITKDIDSEGIREEIFPSENDTNKSSSKSTEQEEFSTVSIEKLESQAKSVFQLRGLPGKELFFLPNDRRPYTGWLRDLEKDGMKTIWEVRDGLRDGSSHFVDAKKIIRTENYSVGRLDGLTTEWYENGQKKLEVVFRNGLKDGMESEWFENGQVKNEYEYVGDFKNGSFRTWFKSGVLHKKGNYLEGKLDGEFVEYHSNGKPMESWKYSKGVPDGPYLSWYENGNKKNEHAYEHGKTHGSYKSWHRTGTKRYDGQFIHGKKDGQWTFFFENGVEMYSKTYKDGVEVTKND